MNNQDNNLNNLNKNQPNNTKSTSPITNRFFNTIPQEDIGGNSSNNGVKNVISWEVGTNKNISPEQITNHNTNSMPEQLIEKVNSDYYNNETLEILDNTFSGESLFTDDILPKTKNQVTNDIKSITIDSIDSAEKTIDKNPTDNAIAINNINSGNTFSPNPVSSNENNFNTQSNFLNSNATIEKSLLNNEPSGLNQQLPKLATPIIQPLSNSINSLSNQTNINNVNKNQNTISDRNNQSFQNMTSNSTNIPNFNSNFSTPNSPIPSTTYNEDLLSNQPLSIASLGGSSLNKEETPKDVVEESKFFNPNINNTIEEKEKINEQFVSNYKQKNTQINNPHPEWNEMTLLKEFIGPNFASISMSPFSFFTFLFGSLYFFYRKMYKIGLVIFVLEALILLILPFKISLIIFLVLRVIESLFINSLYIKTSKKTIKKIMRNKKNQTKNQIQLNEICKKKGRTNLLKAILLSILCYTIEVGLILTIFTGSALLEVFHLINNDTKNIEKNNKYEGFIATKSYNVKENLNITIPDTFKTDSDSSFSYIYNPENTTNINSCTLSIGNLYNFNNAEEFINQFISYNNLSIEKEQISTNGMTWYAITNEDANSKYYLRATEINNEVILLNYNISSNSLNEVCVNYLDEIFSSISLK